MPAIPRCLAAAVAWIGAALLTAPDPALALVKDDIDGGPDVAVCDIEVTVQVDLRQQGIPLIGNTVSLSAATAKLIIREPRPDAPASCITTMHSLSRVGGFAWALVERAAGSTATLGSDNSLTTTLSPDRVGTYRVRFTACPDGCSAPLNAGGALDVAAVTRDLRIDAVDEFAFPPETEPVRPEQAPTAPGDFPGVDAACHTADEVGSAQADTIGPAWVTVRRWQGPQDYETVEGVVTEVNVSRRDAILNHHSQDALFFVRPDPRDRRLVKEGQSGRLEVEWESNSFSEFAWPTRGDRVSVTGYWIHDCGHGGKTEIHPPVMVATHRPRAVAIPAAEGHGNNVFVPGIVTEVFIGRDGGEATGNCSLSGLHQPGGAAGFDFGPHSCLPQTEGFTDGNPINRLFSFTIYLPRNPQQILADAGHSVPPMPLYRQVLNPRNSGGPAPQIEMADGGQALNVTIDLREFSGASYSRRIVAAWAYAAPDNWGLRRWNVTVPLIDVHDDGDSFVRGDGDWKFWINLNNAQREWIRLFDCDGCVHGEETFGGEPLTTAAADSIGPDLLLYPQQRIFVHTTGYETDWIWADGTGRVVNLRPQRDDDYRARSDCQRSGPSGCAHYTLHYSVRDRGGVGEAQLSSAAQARYDAYTLDPDTSPDLPGRVSRDFNHPAELALEGGTMRLDGAGFFQEQELEQQALHDIDNDRYRNAVSRLAELRPDLADAYLTELAEEVAEARSLVPPDELEAGLAALRDSLPPALWQRYLADKSAAGIAYMLLLFILLVLAAIALLLRRT